MKVYRIKHKPSGKYLSSTFAKGEFGLTWCGKVFQKKVADYEYFANNPDYEILWDQLKD